MPYPVATRRIFKNLFEENPAYLLSISGQPAGRNRSKPTENVKQYAYSEQSTMIDWKQKAEYKSEVVLEIGFLIHNSFYFGPDNGFTQDQYNVLREPLAVPELPMSRKVVFTGDVIGKEVQLANYYKNVVSMHEKHRKDMSKSTHFWNRPVIFKERDFTIDFPWHDRFWEGRNVLENLCSSEDGEIYSDRDQGWEVEIFAEGDILFARQWDPDSEQLHCQVKCNRRHIREQSKSVIARTSEIINYLSKELGHDYWT